MSSKGTIAVGRATPKTKKGGARKARDTEAGDLWKSQSGRRRAARLDVNWRADELAEDDVWQRRTPVPRTRASRG